MSAASGAGLTSILARVAGGRWTPVGSGRSWRVDTVGVVDGFGRPRRGVAALAHRDHRGVQMSARRCATDRRRLFGAPQRQTESPQTQELAAILGIAQDVAHSGERTSWQAVNA